MGNGTNRYYHEAQTWGWSVRRGLRWRLEEVQPDGRRENAEGGLQRISFQALFVLSSLEISAGPSLSGEHFPPTGAKHVSELR